MEWISVKDEMPILGKTYGYYRLNYPAFCWIGVYTGDYDNLDYSDKFEYFVELPPLPEKIK